MYVETQNIGDMKGREKAGDGSQMADH